MTDREHFIESSRFAKVVSTAHGDAILIGGYVINVTPPNHDVSMVDWLVSALRQNGVTSDVAKEDLTADEIKSLEVLSGCSRVSASKSAVRGSRSYSQAIIQIPQPQQPSKHIK